MFDIAVKTGMAGEEKCARRHAGFNVFVISGLQTAESLDRIVPKTVKGIISFGLCGGLSGTAQLGQAFIYDQIVTPDGVYLNNAVWRKRLFALSRYVECHCWSTGQFNTANSIQERTDLFNKTGCAVIDDESYAVAGFALRRGIALMGLRVVSDTREDDLPPAVVNSLNTDGSDNIWAVAKSIASDPEQIPALIKTAIEYKKSMDELYTAAIAIGPDFGFAS